MPYWDTPTGGAILRLTVTLLSQSAADNTSTIRRQLSIIGVGSSTSRADPVACSIAGVGATVNSTFTWAQGTTSKTIISADTVVAHDADGTLTVNVTGAIGATGTAGIGGPTTNGPRSYTLPTIPRASRSSLPSTVTLGTTVAINTNRASTGFTHTLQLWEYGVNATSPLATIATGVGGSHSWTPALNLAEYFPNAVSKQFFIRTITYKGAEKIGQLDTVFTLQAPSSMIPTITAINAVDDNPDVASLIGGFVQGQSRLKATVVAEGIYGSTIKSRKVTVDGQTVNSGETVALPTSGTRVVAAAVTDSRGRTATENGSVTVLPYEAPRINEYSVVRALADGSPNVNGAYLLMTLDAAASSLVVGTEKNAMTIRVYTRPRGTTAWTARNVITAGLTYDSSVLITGGGIFNTTTSWDTRVEVIDKLQKSEDYFAASTAGAIVDSTPTKQALGKMVEDAGPTTQIQGPARVYGELDVDGRRVLDTADFATQAEVNAGTATDKLVTPATIRSSTNLPWAMAAGSVLITGFTNGANKSATVTFPIGRFSEPPMVTLTQGTGAPQNAMAAMSSPASTSGFTAYGWRSDSVTTMPVNWIAVQMTPTSGAG